MGARPLGSGSKRAGDRSFRVVCRSSPLSSFVRFSDVHLPHIPLTPPYDFARSIRFWRRSTGELCEQWADGVYRRVISLDGRAAVLSLAPDGTRDAPAVAVALDGRPPTGPELAAVTPLVRELLGDDTPLGPFYAALANDPPMAALAQRLPGLRPTRSPLWETLCWTICGQQISVAFAFALKRRLVERYGEPFTVGGRTLYRFPTPEALAVADPAELRAMQFSAGKASFLTGAAAAIVRGELDLERARALPTEAAVAYLTRFRGIGRWTAEFLLLRGLGRADAFPANDAGVRQGVAARYGERLREPELRAFADRWGPWRGLAALYLLASLRPDD